MFFRDYQEQQMKYMQESGKYPVPDAVRVGGGSICKVCGLEYYDHPPHVPYFFLTCLCDGRVVKL